MIIPIPRVAFTPFGFLSESHSPACPRAPLLLAVHRLHGDGVHTFGHIICLHRVFPNDAENIHVLQDILDADFYHLHPAGTTPATFINNRVPNYNPLSISVRDNYFAGFHF